MLEYERNCLGLYKQILYEMQSVEIFTHLKLCRADAIHNFKRVKIIPISQNGWQLYSNPAD